MKKIFLVALVFFASSEINAQESTLNNTNDANYKIENTPNISYRFIKGPTGFKGPRGAQGAKGRKGLKGRKGSSGARGKNGRVGLTGVKGQQGVQGARGPRGKDTYYYDFGDCGRHEICLYSIEKSKENAQ